MQCGWPAALPELQPIGVIFSHHCLSRPPLSEAINSSLQSHLRRWSKESQLIPKPISGFFLFLQLVIGHYPKQSEAWAEWRVADGTTGLWVSAQPTHVPYLSFCLYSGLVPDGPILAHCRVKLGVPNALTQWVTYDPARDPQFWLSGSLMSHGEMFYLSQDPEAQQASSS